MQQPNWSPVSGTQSILGGPSVYYHVGFSAGDSKQMLIVGGITPSAQSQDNNSAYMYDAARRQWTQLSLPDQDVVHRQGAAVSTTSSGQAYVSHLIKVELVSIKYIHLLIYANKKNDADLIFAFKILRFAALGRKNYFWRSIHECLGTARRAAIKAQYITTSLDTTNPSNAASPFSGNV